MGISQSPASERAILHEARRDERGKMKFGGWSDSAEDCLTSRRPDPSLKQNTVSLPGGHASDE